MRPTLLLLLFTAWATQAQLPVSDDVPRLWPQPASVRSDKGAADLLLSPGTFRIVSTNDDDIPNGYVLTWNVAYYQREIFARPRGIVSVEGINQQGTLNMQQASQKPLTTLQVTVDAAAAEGNAPSVPLLGMDESYELNVTSPVATLHANSVWGALRGLETFSQLLQMNGDFVIQGGDSMYISDNPRFTWRGLMLDPARHFLSVGEINRTIDAMAQNKLNALHLHLTDGESFTVNTEAWPSFSLLSQKGAYAPQLSYTPADLGAIVSHARLRGVRVIPEFDLPAHMASWAQGYPSLITDCPSVNPYPQWPRYYSPADVTQDSLYAAIDRILTELGGVFPDPHWHVGGDEPHYDCWEANAKVSKYKTQHNLTNQGLYAMFEGKYAGLLKAHNKTTMGWDEIQTTTGTTPDKSTVVEVWQGNSALDGVVKAGFRAIVSSNWYLNNGGDWTKYYHDDPLSYVKNGSSEEKARVLGGEACMWNSAFDASSNMEPAVWPNAAAMAEQLWSPAIEDDVAARTRLSQHRCRMVRRGVRASPIAEDYCSAELYVRKSRTYANPGDFPPYPNTPGP